jgi:hypothetical protein
VPLALVGGVATLVYACHALRLPIGRYLWDGLGRPGLTSLAFVVPALAIQRWAHPMGWVPLGLAVGGSWLAFAVCAWRFGLTSAERHRWGRMISNLWASRTGSGAVVPGPVGQGTPGVGGRP